MRLFLHGRSDPSYLQQKLEMGCIASYSSLLLSNWNLHPGILDMFEKLLSLQVIPNIILQNCSSADPRQCQKLVAMLVNAVTTLPCQAGNLTIRYDKQRKFPLAVARGLLQGLKNQPEHCSLHSLTLKGMTFTVETVSLLHEALLHIPSLQELTIQGNFVLRELDRRRTSILGRQSMTNLSRQEEMECIVDILFDILRGLPDLKVLDLQQCHIPDQYMADLLEGLYPEKLCTLRLNGNMCMEESHEVLYDLLMKKNCALQELDLSWQRLSKASKNYSILKLARLTSALADGNNSLQSLNISDNRLLDQDVAELAVALTRNASLKRIHMQNCRITTRGMLALVQTIPHWSDSFKSLFLDGTQRVEKSSRTRKTIYQALLENFHLQVLTLPSSCQRLGLGRKFGWT
jgi:Leucine-rich repeat (LRR) protein